LPARERRHFFFFQAEAGIRGRNVTGVQTCALTIFSDSADWNAAPSTCRKATAPTPVGVKPVAARRVSAAGGRAKRSSRLARFGLVRPSSASKKPMELLVGVVRSGWCGDRAGPADAVSSAHAAESTQRSVIR